jgi:hypothetical protein
MTGREEGGRKGGRGGGSEGGRERRRKGGLGRSSFLLRPSGAFQPQGPSECVLRGPLGFLGAQGNSSPHQPSCLFQPQGCDCSGPFGSGREGAVHSSFDLAVHFNPKDPPNVFVGVHWVSGEPEQLNPPSTQLCISTPRTCS